jgi:hypothetical protein
VSRLLHSLPGYIRSLQISSAKFVLFTEGKIDRPFYSGVLREVLRTRTQITSSIRSAAELPDSTGGKQSLLKFFDALLAEGKLVSSLAGKVTVVFICVDKDIDDLKGVMRRSPHIFYTEYFDVESYIYRNGNLVAVAAAASMLDHAPFQAALVDVRKWTGSAANMWKDWVSVCVFEVLHQSVARGNFRICPSPIHRKDGTLDRGSLVSRRVQMEIDSNRSVQEFSVLWDEVHAEVDRLYAAGLWDGVFKGKWYGWWLGRCIEAIAKTHSESVSCADGQLPKYLLTTLDYSAPWASGIRLALSNVIDGCLPAH